VLFETPQDAQRAIQMYNGYLWDGRKLEVREDRSQTSTQPAFSLTAQIESPPRSTKSASPPSEQVPRAVSEPLASATPPVLPSAAPVDPAVPMSQPSASASLGLAPGAPGPTVGQTPASVSTAPITISAPHPASQCKVFINNLPFHVDWNDVKNLFSRAGTVVHAFVAYHNDTRSKGYGSVQFSTPEEAQRAIVMFNQQPWEGRILHVREDRGFGSHAQPHTPSRTAHAPPVRLAAVCLRDRHSLFLTLGGAVADNYQLTRT
jgi:RNA recognition motif-containing protein